MEMILSTKVISDVSERRAACLGHSVVDDDHVIFVSQHSIISPTSFTLALLQISNLMYGNGTFCTEEINQQVIDNILRHAVRNYASALGFFQA